MFTVITKKEAVDSPIGLSLNYYDGGAIVARNVADDGLFAHTDLKAGFILLRVNGTDVKGLSTAQAMALFTAAESSITVVAEDIGLRIVNVAKDESNSKVGIGLKERDGAIVVSSIAADGLMANTDIKVGQQLLGVNGVCCKSISSREAITLFQELESMTILAQDVGVTSVTVDKESVDTKVGIGLKQINGHMVISSLTSDSLFANTGIKPAQRLVSVGSKDVGGLSKGEAISLIKNTVGPLTITTDQVGLFCVTVTKDTADTKLGISLNEVDGKVVISDLLPDGLFAGTELQIGLRLVCINNAVVQGLTVPGTIALLKQAEGDVVIMAEKVGLICVKATKESPTSKIGIGLKDLQGSVVVSSITEDSLFAGTNLKVGHKIVTINKASCINLNKMEAIALVKEAKGDITLLVEDIGLIGVTVSKESAETKVGIGLKEVNGEIVISSIYDSGLFSKTGLMENQKLVSINNTSVRGLNKSQAIDLFKKAEGNITVMAVAP